MSVSLPPRATSTSYRQVKKATSDASRQGDPGTRPNLKLGYANGGSGKGHAHGNGISYADTQVNAQDNLSIVSGHDLSLIGAQAGGQHIGVTVGHDMTVISPQATDSYHGSNHAVGGGLIAGAGIVTGGISLSQGHADNSYHSVDQASGFQAGAGGYDILVGNHTGLVGGQLASTATPDKNILNTGSLSYEDLDNRSHWSADQTGLSLSDNPLQSAWGSAGAALGLVTPQHHDSGSTTHSGVAPGTVIVRDDPNQDLGGLNQSQTHLDGSGIKNGFDPAKIARNQETGQVAAEVGMRAAGDIEQALGWKAGSKESTLLHGIVGAGAAALGGGNALQGAAGASASEAAAGAMQDYLVKQGIDPNGKQGRLLMQLGSLGVGAAAGAGSGAAAALNGQLYNEQLHPDLLKGVLAKVNAFAKENGLSPEEAQNRLLVEAMRLQDSGYNLGISSDQIGGSQGLPDDAQARAFFEQNRLYTVNGATVDIFQPASPEDSKQNAFALYGYLYQDADAAKAYYGAQSWALAQRGIDTTEALQNAHLAGWANQDVLANYHDSDLVKQTESDFLKFYGQTAMIGATGGLSAGVPLLAAANAARDGGITSNVLGYMLTSRMGAGLIAGVVNAGSQEVQGRPFHWADAGMAAVGGSLGVGGGLSWNALVGAASGYWQAQIDNRVYPKEDKTDPFINAITAGAAGSIGLGASDKATGILNNKMPGSLRPIILGNLFGSSASEISGDIANQAIDNSGDVKKHHE